MNIYLLVCYTFYMNILPNLQHWPLPLFNQSNKPRIEFQSIKFTLDQGDFLMLMLLSSYSFQSCITDFSHNFGSCFRIPCTYAQKHLLTTEKIMASECSCKKHLIEKNQVRLLDSNNMILLIVCVCVCVCGISIYFVLEYHSNIKGY